MHEAYSRPTLPTFPAIAVELSDRLAPGNLAAFNEVDPEHNHVEAFLDRPDPSLMQPLARFAELQMQHPSIRHVMETGDGSAVKISDFITQAEFQRLDIYREVYALIDAEHQMSFTLPAPLPRIIGIAVNRSGREGDFTEEERTLLNLLRPHLMQSYEHLRMRAVLIDRLDSVGRLLGDQGSMVLLLGEPPYEATPGAFVALYRYFGRPGRNAALPDRVQHWVENQRSRLHAGSDGTVPAPFQVLTTVRDDVRLVARFVPGASGPDALVLTTRPAGVGDQELGLLGLSPREAEVLRMLSSGATNAMIGDRLHIAAGTVKKHLDSIYRKLGVTGRVQAVSMGLGLLPGEPDRRATPH